jgi:hypothetical protein
MAVEGSLFDSVSEVFETPFGQGQVNCTRHPFMDYLRFDRDGTVNSAYKTVSEFSGTNFSISPSAASGWGSFHRHSDGYTLFGDGQAFFQNQNVQFARGHLVLDHNHVVTSVSGIIH